ncbi:isocitrate lyase/PEP mutase family protein [Fusibacter bizertensis]
MTADKKRLRLRELLLEEGCTPVPGVYDALGAKLAESTGFDAIYLGSYATAVSVFGQPDVGSVTMTEMVAHAKNIANSVDIPLICDAENGWFHAANIWRTVHEMEQAGVSGIHIEDHEFGKHTPLDPVILDTDKMCKKIEAAVAARTDKNFLIIARTDVAWALGDLDEMVIRANRYLESGADAVFLAFDASMISKELRNQINGPVVMPGSQLSPVKYESELGISISLYWPMLLNVAFVSMKEALENLKASQDYSTLGRYLVPEQEINPYIGYDAFIDRGNKYL